MTYSANKIVQDFVESFVCGAIAGVSSKTVVLPFDLVKKRLAVSPDTYTHTHTLSAAIIYT